MNDLYLTLKFQSKAEKIDLISGFFLIFIWSGLFYAFIYVPFNISNLIFELSISISILTISFYLIIIGIPSYFKMGENETKILYTTGLRSRHYIFKNNRISMIRFIKRINKIYGIEIFFKGQEKYFIISSDLGQTIKNSKYNAIKDLSELLKIKIDERKMLDTETLKSQLQYIIVD